MLQVAERSDASDRDFSPVMAETAARAPAYIPAGSRYGEDRRFGYRALLITAALHAVIVAGLLGVKYHSEAKREAKLISVNLTPSAPPPPPPSAKTPMPPKATIQAPIPLIQTPRPAPPVIVTSDPAPVPPPQPVAAPAPPAPPAPPAVIQSSDLGARMVSGRPPRYPVESRRSGEQGTVVLALTVGTDGAVANIAVHRSSGFPRLDDAALGAVRTWRWAPIVRDGVAVVVKGIVPIPFVLQGVAGGRHRGGGRHHRRDEGGFEE